MKLASFDVFDTLLCRCFSIPTDLHRTVGEEALRGGLISLSAEDYARHRIDAENHARTKAAGHETNFEEIFQVLKERLGWSKAIAIQVSELELLLEDKALDANPQMFAPVEAARRKADLILFLSDMYLPSDFIERKLRRAGFFRDGDRLYVSGEIRRSKASGEMFAHIRQQYPAITSWTHCGDNPIADVSAPKQFGIATEEYNSTKLTRSELIARGKPSLTPPWRSKLAGAMRLARLAANSSTDRERIIWETGCSVAGPLYFGFVRWVLDEAAARGLRRLYFISRDGQIFLKIAREISRHWPCSIECRYLYGSRQAWRPAAIEKLSEEEWSWLLPPNLPMSIAQALARAGMETEELSQELESAGFPRSTWRQPLNDQQRRRALSLLQDNRVRGRLLHATGACRKLLLRYLAQEGLCDGERAGLVDIGWFGNLQRSLLRILAHQSQPVDLTGFYFALFPGGGSNPHMLDYSTPALDIARENIAMFEIFAEGDHGSVTRYCDKDGRVQPVLAQAGNERALRWGLAHLHGGITAFAEKFAATCLPCDVPAREFQAVSAELYRRFYYHPTRAEAAAWADFEASEHLIDPAAGRLIPTMTTWQTLRALIHHHERPLAWWMEGSCALSQNPVLATFLLARRWRRRLQDLRRR